MKTITVIENATELLDLAPRPVPEGDESMRLPGSAKLVFENDFKTVVLEGAPGFVLGDDVTVTGVIIALAVHAGFKVSIT